MIQNLLDDISKKVELCREWYKIEIPAPYIFNFKHDPKVDQIKFTIMAITHGSESNGLSVLNQLLDSIIQNGKDNLSELPKFNFSLIASNYKAALLNKRYMESDLNRSFGLDPKNLTTQEHQRAYEISQLVLNKTDYLLDIHQTILASEKPFFIFPFTQKGIQLANAICNKTSIVTHWSGGFSKDGMCTDEYTNKQGGVGISIETGQCGVDQQQADYASKLILNFITKLNSKGFSLPNIDDIENNIYTWKHVEPYPKEHVELVEGLSNFKHVKKDIKLGVSQSLEIVAKETGVLMFPKYVNKDDDRPAELYRIAHRVEKSDLPN